jgi:DNA-binding LytR/AlgR family response regulator
MQKNIRVLIAEDEFITLDTLRDYLEQSGYEIAGDAMSAKEAIAILDRFDTDIAILDINLKGDKDGIWLAEQIRKNYRIPFIFLTAYSDAATIQKAANVNPYGYLVKPFKQADIYSAIEVALKNYAKESNPLELSAENLENPSELLINQSIFVKTDLAYKKIILADIRYIQSFGNYIEIHFQTQKIVIRSTLQRFINILPKKHFVQVHRSFVVNIQSVEEINANFIKIGTNSIPLSKSHKEEFVNKLNFFM